MEGRLLVAYLLQEMTQNQLSGYIYYAAKGGKGGKVFVTQGVLCGLTYEGSPISVSELDALEITKAVILQDMPGPTTPSPETPSATSVLQTLRRRDVRTPEPPQDQPKVNLVDDVLPLLESLYGEQAIQSINKISAQFPPAQQPWPFLGKCQELAALTLGPQAAQTMFQPLYKKVQPL